MNINENGLNLIKTSEGLRLNAYPDPATGGDPWTIGYGSTGPDVKKGLTITQEDAETRLKNDIAKFETGVSNLVKVPLTSNQFSALVCFSFNVGIGNLKASSLLRLLNSGAKNEDIAAQFLRWDKAGGKSMPGLTTRRKAESDLFLRL